MDFDIRDMPTRDMLQRISAQVPEIDVPATEMLLLFMRTSFNMFRVSSEGFEQFGISPGKYALLILLYRHLDKGLPASELAERASVTKATVTGLVERLERDGLVRRRNHASDRRISIIYLSEQGLELMERLLPVHFRSASYLMSGLSETERTLLLELIGKIEANIPAAHAVYRNHPSAPS
ncbi:MarR family transcriptional regulator [Paenibacillus campi]|uniref:MarR family winged helix-turn-helix transcriptional regulator n=1 Tax=Paenibacillus campi TaxID=3106031 RepID=UPI002AFE8DB5|nr:MarR family transcriptional regulator [Paenibacillus sp. SGZ-1009]